MESREHITVLVHGTYANKEYDGDLLPPDPDREKYWWRLTPPGNEGDTPADQLHASIHRRLDPLVTAGVWAPRRDRRDGDIGFRDFLEWSGANTDRARRKAARNLAGTLGELADRRGCTPEQPLTVNYVAHSHGGNVVLESLTHQRPNVRARQVALLGTPLTWRFTDLRILYLSFLFLFLGAYLYYDIEWLVDVAQGNAEQNEGLVFELIISVLLLSPIFWLTYLVISIARWVINKLSGGGRPAYGPRPDELATLVDRPVQLFISRDDEADLMLQLGAAPLKAYRALVRARPKLKGRGLIGGLIRLPLRAAELLILRPFAYVVLAPLLEIALERFGLGFPLRSVAVRNYEMLTWSGNEQQVYGSVIQRMSIDSEELIDSQRRARRRRLARVQAATEASSEDDPDLRMRLTLIETLNGLTQQVHLSHSGYYETPVVIERVAAAIADEALTGADRAAIARTVELPPPPPQPTVETF